MAGLYLIGFAAPAFEAAACHVGETKDPNRNVPRAMFASAVMATLYFLVLPVDLARRARRRPARAATSPTRSARPSRRCSAAPRSAAAIWFMVFNMFHGTLQPLAGAARTLLQLAEDGLLPRILAMRIAHRRAVVATLLTGRHVDRLPADRRPDLADRRGEPHLPDRDLPAERRRLAAAPQRARRASVRIAHRAGRSWLGVVAALVWMVSTLLGFQQFGLPTVLAGIGLATPARRSTRAAIWSDRRREGLPGFSRSLHMKLTGAMLARARARRRRLPARGDAASTAHRRARSRRSRTSSSRSHCSTISVGLVLPGMIGHALGEVAQRGRPARHRHARRPHRAMQAPRRRRPRRRPRAHHDRAGRRALAGRGRRRWRELQRDAGGGGARRRVARRRARGAESGEGRARAPRVQRPADRAREPRHVPAAARARARARGPHRRRRRRALRRPRRLQAGQRQLRPLGRRRAPAPGRRAAADALPATTTCRAPAATSSCCCSAGRPGRRAELRRVVAIAERMAERIRDALHDPFQLAGNEVLVTASVGAQHLSRSTRTTSRTC